MIIAICVTCPLVPCNGRRVCEILQRRTGLWIKKADGKTRLIFSASSEYELTGWALSFADDARVVKPKWLVEKVSQTIKNIEKVYS
ncbi:MAG: WYL domain-containing protein [Thermodesulfobacteriota bacterium]|nr:WYL domain-containing protein [Thermodesulfobacteriota bacterium]